MNHRFDLSDSMFSVHDIVSLWYIAWQPQAQIPCNWKFIWLFATEAKNETEQQHEPKPKIKQHSRTKLIIVNVEYDGNVHMRCIHSMRTQFSCIIKSLKQLRLGTVEHIAVTTDYYQCDKSNGCWTLDIENWTGFCIMQFWQLELHRPGRIETRKQSNCIGYGNERCKCVWYLLQRCFGPWQW